MHESWTGDRRANSCCHALGAKVVAKVIHLTRRLVFQCLESDSEAVLFLTVTAESRLERLRAVLSTFPDN